jgi:hypothetical protein
LPAGFNPSGIGPSNQVLGSYLTDYSYQDVIYQNGVITMPGDDPLAVPGTTAFLGVNASGQIVGNYTDSSGIVHGFLATPIAPPANEKTRVNIDLPNADVHASGTYTAAGWAVDNTTSINGVSIQVDGQFVGLATYGHSRPDLFVKHLSLGGWSTYLRSSSRFQ